MKIPVTKQFLHLHLIWEHVTISFSQKSKLSYEFINICSLRNRSQQPMDKRSVSPSQKVKILVVALPIFIQPFGQPIHGRYSTILYHMCMDISRIFICPFYVIFFSYPIVGQRPFLHIVLHFVSSPVASSCHLDRSDVFFMSPFLLLFLNEDWKHDHNCMCLFYLFF